MYQVASGIMCRILPSSSLQLLDISTLDLVSQVFSSSILAASALYLASERSRQHFQAITGICIVCHNSEPLVHSRTKVSLRLLCLIVLHLILY